MLNPNFLRRCKKHNVNKVDRSIDLMAVYIRFNGKCQKCGVITSKGLHPQQKHSATIEHIKPLSKGGNHTWKNVTLYCHGCNSGVNEDMRKSLKSINKEYRFSLFGFEMYIKRFSK